MSTTEAPFVVSHNFCAIRANTVAELEQQLTEFVNRPSMPSLINAFRSAVNAQTQGVTQPVTTTPVPSVSAHVDSVAVAMDNLAAAGVPATVVETTAIPIEVREDKWGGKYMRGNPDAGDCAHGGRIVKDWTDKSGKRRTAYVCTNDSPFGDYRQGKCDLVWPARR